MASGTSLALLFYYVMHERTYCYLHLSPAEKWIPDAFTKTYELMSHSLERLVHEYVIISINKHNYEKVAMDAALRLLEYL